MTNFQDINIKALPLPAGCYQWVKRDDRHIDLIHKPAGQVHALIRDIPQTGVMTTGIDFGVQVKKQFGTDEYFWQGDGNDNAYAVKAAALTIRQTLRVEQGWDKPLRGNYVGMTFKR